MTGKPTPNVRMRYISILKFCCIFKSFTTAGFCWENEETACQRSAFVRQNVERCSRFPATVTISLTYVELASHRKLYNKEKLQNKTTFENQPFKAVVNICLATKRWGKNSVFYSIHTSFLRGPKSSQNLKWWPAEGLKCDTALCY